MSMSNKLALLKAFIVFNFSLGLAVIFLVIVFGLDAKLYLRLAILVSLFIGVLNLIWEGNK